MYHKIQSIYKRNPETKYKTFLMGQYSMPEFEYLANSEWVWTEKIDGTNIRVIWYGTESLHSLEFRGKTDNAQLYKPLEEKLFQLFPIQSFDDCYSGMDMVLYGEGFGPKIQKGGGNYGPSVDFILFDVNIGGIWLERENVEDIASKLGIKVVPVVGKGTLTQAVLYTKLGFNSTFSTEGNEFLAEGLVLRPAIELQTRLGHRIITKVKHRDFNNE